VAVEGNDLRRIFVTHSRREQGNTHLDFSFFADKQSAVGERQPRFLR
jgi:hypothetical protein